MTPFLIAIVILMAIFVIIGFITIIVILRQTGQVTGVGKQVLKLTEQQAKSTEQQIKLTEEVMKLKEHVKRQKEEIIELRKELKAPKVRMSFRSLDELLRELNSKGIKEVRVYPETDIGVVREREAMWILNRRVIVTCRIDDFTIGRYEKILPFRELTLKGVLTEFEDYEEKRKELDEELFEEYCKVRDALKTQGFIVKSGILE